jgi:hypothetical protein
MTFMDNGRRDAARRMQAGRRSEWEKRTRSGGLDRRFAASAVVSCVLTGILVGGLTIAAQSGASDRLDTRTQGPAILAHLNEVIQFYREAHVPVQKTGEPNDAVYQDEATALATEAANLAFQSAKAEAALLGGQPGGESAGAGESEQQQRLEAAQAAAEKRISDLEERQAELDKQMVGASPRTLTALQAERKQVMAALELANAMKSALGRIETASSAATSTGLPAEIVRLQGAAPELQSKAKESSAPLTTVGSALSAGITTQGAALIEMMGTLHSLTTLSRANDHLRQQAITLRAPMLQIVRGLLQQGDALSQQAEEASPQPAGRTGKAATAPAGLRPRISKPSRRDSRRSQRRRFH